MEGAKREPRNKIKLENSSTRELNLLNTIEGLLDLVPDVLTKNTAVPVTFDVCEEEGVDRAVRFFI